MKLKKQERIEAHKKFEARQIAKSVLQPVKDEAIQELHDRGAMHPERKFVMAQQVQPWLIDQMELVLRGEYDEVEGVLGTITNVLQTQTEEHFEKIKDEAHRLKMKRMEESNIEKTKIEDKLQRKADREA